MSIRSAPGAPHHIGIPGLLLLAAILPGVEAMAVSTPAVAVFHQEGGAPACYLVMDASHLVLQDGDGVLRSSMRVVAEGQGVFAGYGYGVANGVRLDQTPDGLRMHLRDGTVEVFRQVATAPPAIGWQPYALPVAAAGDAAARTRTAERLHLYASECQRLEQACTEALKDPAVARGAVESPAIQARARHQGIMLAWLRETLQTTGWIASGSGPHVAGDLAALAPAAAGNLRLMATLRAGVLAELARGTFPERDAVAILDACAAALGDPLPYGSVVQFRMSVEQPGMAEQVILVPADVTEVESARHRAGLPRLGQFAAVEEATIIRLGDDGRQVGEMLPIQPAPEAVQPDVVVMDQAARDPQRALRDLAARDPAFAKALAEAGQGRIAALAAWVGGAGSADRMLFSIAIQQQPRQGGPGDPAEARFALRNLYAAYLSGAPRLEEAPRIAVSRDLALGLAGRAAAPTAAELEQASGLAATLERGLQRRDLRANPPIAHPMADALACIYYRQGRMAEAAATWKKAIAWAGATVPEAYRRRLQAAESGGKADALPR
jgi:hypothetical protein